MMPTPHPRPPVHNGVATDKREPTVEGPALVHLGYDEPVLGYHQRVAELAASRTGPGGCVVDVGCGTGQTLAELARRRPDLDLVGLDGDPECLRRASARVPGARLALGDIAILDRLPGHHGDPDGACDVVVSSHSLEHLACPVDALARWAGLLRPGGHLVVAVPNALQPPLLARALARRDKVNRGHFYIWDSATFTNFCHLAGFRVVEQTVDYVPLVPVRYRRKLPGVAAIERALVRPLPRLANSLIVVLSES